MKTFFAFLLITLAGVCAAHSLCTPPEPTFTHCANEYGSGSPNNCAFSGMRVVRFGNENGWKTRKFFKELPAWECKASNFDGGELGEGPHRCEYSSDFDTAAVTPPAGCADRHDCAGLDMAMPAGATPYTTSRVTENTPFTLTPDSDIGAFRTGCEVSHFAYDDPLVFPGQPGASHLHMFFGNDSVTSMSDTTNLANVGGSTCEGGTLNRSAYWVPALLDMSTHSPLMPASTAWYYKEGYNGLAGHGFGSLPVGLGMIGTSHTWYCEGQGVVNDGLRHAGVVSCPAGGLLILAVDFPQCWDGVNKWLADKSHTAYPADGHCPASHPVPLPQITLNIRFLMQYDGQSDNVMLSSDSHHGGTRGSSAHADWVNGWNAATSDLWVNNCLNAGADCHNNILGDGTSLR
jgi:hypothetical protein